MLTTSARLIHNTTQNMQVGEIYASLSTIGAKFVLDLNTLCGVKVCTRVEIMENRCYLIQYCGICPGTYYHAYRCAKSHARLAGNAHQRVSAQLLYCRRGALIQDLDIIITSLLSDSRIGRRPASATLLHPAVSLTGVQNLPGYSLRLPLSVPFSQPLLSMLLFFH